MGRSGSLDIPALPAPRGQWRAPQLTDCQLAALNRNRTGRRAMGRVRLLQDTVLEGGDLVR